MAGRDRSGLSTKQLWVGVLALFVIWAAVAIAKHGHSGESRLQSWCRNDVHIGDRLSSLNMPQGVVSVSDGAWQYDDGVSIQFVDGLVYTKTCS